MFYRQFADISAMPILIDTTDVDEFVDTVIRIAPTFGGIHLEDLAAPACFEFERRLIMALLQPVMHTTSTARRWSGWLPRSTRASTAAWNGDGGVDVVVATTGRMGLIEPNAVPPGQVILASPTPIPEITPEAARVAGQRSRPTVAASTTCSATPASAGVRWPRTHG